jgi:hypothetical protein
MNRNVHVPFLGEGQRQRWPLTRLRAVVTTGTKQGRYVGRVLVRASGSFDIQTKQGRVQGISHRFCSPVHRGDGYSYAKGEVSVQEPPTPSA